jgi:capsular exopolysaccharide synthesis family protein
MILKGRIDLRPERNTSFIDIFVSSDDAQEAANLANEIASTYLKYRQDERKELSHRGMSVLILSIEEQERKIAAQQAKVDSLREELKVPDSLAYVDSPSMLLTAEAVRKLDGQRIELETSIVREKTVYTNLTSLSKATLEQVLPTTMPDNLLNSLLEQRSLAQQALVQKKTDYGDKHPDLVKIRETIDDLNQKISDRVEGIMISVENRVKAAQNALDALVGQLETAKSNDISTVTRLRPYFDAKNKLEELKRWNLALTGKSFQETIETALPKSLMVQIMDPAQVNRDPIKPKKALNIILGIVIGLVVGVGLAFFIEYLDTSVKTIDDVERSLQSAVLGVIPQNVGLVLEEGVDSPHAEAYRVLRTNLLFSRKDDKLNTVAVVSAGAGEGKSTTVFNLAAVFAQSRQRVLIVDSDLRRPTLHKMLHVSNSLGLTNYLLKQNTLEEVIQTTGLPTMDFLASGKLPSSSLGILSSAQMKDLITELKRRYDFVFFDSPPIMGVSDASILASEVDMTLQVIQYRRYPQPMNIRAKQLIEKVGGNLIGIVLNNINMSQDESYYYYSGYYHEYYSRNDDQEPARAEAGAQAGDDGSKA